MKKIALSINCLILSVITTALILTVSFVVMLFSSAEEGYRTTYFNSLYFSNIETETGSLVLEFGMAKG